MRHRLADGFCGLLSLRKNIGYPFVGVWLTKPRSCRYEMGKIASVWRRNIPLPKRIRKNESGFAAHRGAVRVRLCTIRTEQGIDEILVGIERTLFGLNTR